MSFERHFHEFSKKFEPCVTTSQKPPFLRDANARPIPSCISQLPTGAKPARLRTQVSPNSSGVVEPVFEHGAACVRYPDARTVAGADRARIRKDGSWTNFAQFRFRSVWMCPRIV